MSDVWPYQFRITHRIRIGSQLTMELEVENLDLRAFTFEEALHTYFAVQDVRQIAISGLREIEYLDKVADFARKIQEQEQIRVTGETDRVYVDTTATCVIDDPGLERRIAVSKSGSESTIVWNPWIDKARAMTDFGDSDWQRMVCVETGNVGAAAVRLEPGEIRQMSATIDVQRSYRSADCANRNPAAHD
jgi:glucose-6-phosphate 1-epimerase